MEDDLQWTEEQKQYFITRLEEGWMRGKGYDGYSWVRCDVWVYVGFFTYNLELTIIHANEKSALTLIANDVYHTSFFRNTQGMVLHPRTAANITKH